MTKKLHVNGLTLVELIVASVLISVILLGIVAFSASLQQMQDTSINTSTGNYQASVIMSFLRNDITVATGNAIDPGIVSYDDNGTTSLCLRQPGGNPMDFSSNTWNCYFYEKETRNLVRCVAPSNAPPLTTIDDCKSGAEFQYLNKLNDKNFFVFSTPGEPIGITLNVVDGTTQSYLLQAIVTPLNHTR